MPHGGAFVGREHERAELGAALREAADGRGGLVLLAGEAGLGKTRLAQECLRECDLLVLHGGASQEATPPYGPIVAALRSYLRVDPAGLDDCGPLTAHLRLALPELGRRPTKTSPETVHEVLRCAFAAIARRQPAAVLLDDLHWADDTTLIEVLPMLAVALDDEPLLLIGAYRSDEIPRGHPVRRLRRDLRRAGALRELQLEPLSEQETALVAADVLGEEPSPALAALLAGRTQGVPFFVEELAAALAAGDMLRPGRRGLELLPGGELPIPDTIRDAVLLRAASLSDEARAVLSAAAVAGLTIDLDLVAWLAGESGLDEALESGILVETEPGTAAFRHALAREAVYGDIPWTRRRSLHRRLAERLEAAHAAPPLVAEHWLAARESDHARRALLTAFDDACAIHAHRDAMRLGRRVLDLWPEGPDEELRIEVAERLAQCAELGGDLPEAARAWREAAAARRARGEIEAVGEAERRLANAYALQGAHDRELVSRRAAAEAFAASGRLADAARELLAAAAHQDSAGRLGTALDLVAEARAHAERVERPDLVARALGIEGTARAKLGQIDAGLAAARAGLELALEHDVDGAAIEAYQRLANALENAAQLERATQAYAAAHALCNAQGADAAGSVCLICLAYILLQTGEWDQCLELGRELAALPQAPLGVRIGTKQQLAYIAVFRGDVRRARRLLDQTVGHGELHERERVLVWEALGAGLIAELEGRLDVAVDRACELVTRWGDAESRHYQLPALRWAITLLAEHGAEKDARAAAESVVRLASTTASPEALATLACVLGELARLDGDPERAAEHFVHAVDLLSQLRLVYDVAQAQLRAGAALASAGDREAAVIQLVDAHRTARKLGARPLAARAASELAALGEPVERRLGRRAAAQLGGPGLSRRELEVMRLVAAGRTNREIAHDLYLSTRTIDMHVRNILVKLRCRSRADATRKAGELGLIA